MDHGGGCLASEYLTGNMVAFQFLGIPFSMDSQSWPQLAHCLDLTPVRCDPVLARLSTVLDINCAKCNDISACYLHE